MDSRPRARVPPQPRTLHAWLGRRNADPSAVAKTVVPLECDLRRAKQRGATKQLATHLDAKNSGHLRGPVIGSHHQAPQAAVGNVGVVNWCEIVPAFHAGVGKPPGCDPWAFHEVKSGVLRGEE